MTYRRILSIVLTGFVMIAIAGCAGGAPAPAVTEPVVSTATVDQAPAPSTLSPGTGIGTSLCSNPLFPVIQGATWTYSTTGAPDGPFTYTDTITNVRDDGFTLTSQLGDVARTQEWSCTAEGLFALSLGGGNAGSLSADGMSAQFTTSDPAGITLPVTITPSLQWTNGMNIQGTFSTSAGQSAEGTGTVTIEMQEAGTESVTVLAGTFDATRIQATTTFNLSVAYGGLNIPLELTGNSVLWYAPGVGLVKSTESGAIAGQAFSATTELQSYNIP